MRWLKFNAVGALGMAVQLAVLAFFVHVVRLHYLVATALAVEAAVIHNFVWHCRWTWTDRFRAAGPAWGQLLLRFNLTTGAVSLAGNLFCMAMLVGHARLDPFLANLASICFCALVNFLVCDRFVFLSRLSSIGGTAVAAGRGSDLRE